MEQTVIKIGNSVGVVIPQVLQKDSMLKPGDRVIIEKDTMSDSFIVSKKGNAKRSSITPEFLGWLKKFNQKHKDALAQLAKR